MFRPRDQQDLPRFLRGQTQGRRQGSARPAPIYQCPLLRGQPHSRQGGNGGDGLLQELSALTPHYDGGKELRKSSRRYARAGLEGIRGQHEGYYQRRPRQNGQGGHPPFGGGLPRLGTLCRRRCLFGV